VEAELSGWSGLASGMDSVVGAVDGVAAANSSVMQQILRTSDAALAVSSSGSESESDDTSRLSALLDSLPAEMTPSQHGGTASLGSLRRMYERVYGR